MPSPYSRKGKKPYLYLYPSCKHATSVWEQGVTTDSRGIETRYSVTACTRCHIITGGRREQSYRSDAIRETPHADRD